MASSIHIFICFLIFTSAPGFNLFCMQWLVINISVAFIDAMAEGITAINTKISSKITKLQEAERRATGAIEEGEENEMKSFGMFNIIRGILRSIMSIIGGVLANKLTIGQNYALVGIYPIAMLFYTIFIFSENKVIFF